MRRGQGRLADRQLDHDVGGKRGKAATFLDHGLGRRGGGLGRDRQALADLANLDHMRLEVGELAARLGVEGRVGCHAGQNAPARRLANLVEVGGVDEELHDVPLSARRLAPVIRPNWHRT